MSHDHAHHHHPMAPTMPAAALSRLAFSATAHCLTGCAIGEVLGLVIGTALGWGNAATIALAVGLAFLFTIMEMVDNAIMLVIPGAMEAGLGDPLFWGSLAVALVIAGAAAFPVNRWLIARGRGHAVVHRYHGHH